MTSRKTPKVNFRIQFPSVFDISHIRNIALLKVIIKNHPVDLYFFWRIGAKDIEKKSINIQFPDWNRNHVKIQTHTNLTQIRIKNKTISLLKPLDRDYDPKKHDIEFKKFRLSRSGKKIWTQAREDGLWHVFSKIPKSNCLDFEKFEEHFRSHIFLFYTDYLEKIKELSSLSTFREMRVPKRRRKKYRNNYDPFYVPKEEKILIYPLQSSLQSTPKTSVKTLNRFNIHSPKLLRKLQDHIMQHPEKRVSPPSVTCKKFMSYYISNSFLPHLTQSQNSKFTTVLFNRIKLLHRKGYIKISYIKARHKIVYYLRLTNKGIRYSKGSQRILPKIKHAVTTYLRHLTSSGPKTRRNTVLSFTLGKIGTLSLWMILILILIPIQEIWYQKEYYTPIYLLYTYFSKLKFFILLSASIYSFFLITPIHFIISIKLIRKKRWSYKIIIIYWGIIAVITSSILITNLIFLFGV